MTQIPLTKGKRALVDSEDAARAMSFKWTYYFNPQNSKEYARRSVMLNGKHHSIYLHRFIMRAPNGIQVDHKDNDGLNCQKSNLRFANNSQNHQNMKVGRHNKSGFKGVCRSETGSWMAYIKTVEKAINLGRFSSPEAAAHAYDAKAREVFGEFARTNFAEPYLDYEAHRTKRNSIRSHCRRGHLKAGDNLRIHSGARICVTCWRDSKVRARAQKKQTA